ncbi:hypothetical protein IVB30_39825 [Bradyrhizobium sp. 200]|uniref:hypothetical protein n=1 Tax=Bradyrhizobium sp. 200 TaxID=2782665 RepID=UPI001FFE664A|nr:hypothetical protein [Bradyrhizobium sp. 200]UPJ49059.1 hypothetical protein IVB30_39825 [Bradyrhizobium sp. 200]
MADVTDAEFGERPVAFVAPSRPFVDRDALREVETHEAVMAKIPLCRPGAR